MNRLLQLFIFSLCIVSVAGVVNAQPITAVGERTLENYLQPFLKQYCNKCHNSDVEEAGLDLEKFWLNETLYEDREVWEKVIAFLSDRKMPPEDQPQPNEELRLSALEFIQKKLEEFSCEGMIQPGRVTIRRLNRNEYTNTIRDLIGIDFQATADFPADEVGYGFDNIGDVLSMSPLLMERYLEAAIKITNQAILSELPLWPPVERHEAELFTSHVPGEGIRPYEVNGLYMGLYVNGRASKNITFETPGRYRFRIRAYGEQAGPDPTALELVVDNKQVASFVVDTFDDAPGFYEAEMELSGTHNVAIGFLNNYNQGGQDRNVLADYIDIEGPLGVARPPLPTVHRNIIPERPQPGKELEVARNILEKFGGRAYRRPMKTEEVDRLLALVKIVLDDSGTFEESIQVAVQGVLSSPAFLFRWELDPGSGETEEEAPVRLLNDYEMASRLSYYLWNSMPDEELFEAAKRHDLSDTRKLLVQVNRMLADPKSQRFIKNFVGQWLQIRNLDRVTPDPDLFPTFNNELKEAMRTETEMFFEAIVREDRSLLDLLDADFTFLNERLANHYGIDGVKGTDFQRIALDAGSNRGGVLTHGSVLTITSNSNRTSPVVRGKWILEQLLGTPPPPPPANVPELKASNNAEEVQSKSLRESMELHRENVACAACHQKMDPLGFAFENFDAIGRWRDLDGRASIDPSGKLTSGEEFAGPDELKHILKSRVSFVRTVSEKMLTYALGRGLKYYDKCAVDSITEQLEKNQYRFSALITGIVTSNPFRMKQIDGE